MSRNRAAPAQPYYPERRQLRIGPHKLRVLLSAPDRDLAKLHWYLSGDGYAIRRVRTAAGRSGTVYLHHVVAQRLLGPVRQPRRVLLKNRCRLDCRRENLDVRE